MCVCVCVLHTYIHTKTSVQCTLRQEEVQDVACPCIVLEMGVEAAGLLGNPFILCLNISYEMAIGLEREREREGERERELF